MPINKKNSHVPLFIILALLIILAGLYFVLMPKPSGTIQNIIYEKPTPVAPTISVEELQRKREQAAADKTVYSSSVNGKVMLPSDPQKKNR